MSRIRRRRRLQLDFSVSRRIVPGYHACSRSGKHVLVVVRPCRAALALDAARLWQKVARPRVVVVVFGIFRRGGLVRG
jgi:hypothetical protein